MPFALSVKSVNASAGAIVSLWDQVSVFEDSPSMRALDYPPHITFAIYDAPEVSKEMAIAAIENAAQGRRSIEITFNRIRTFDGPSLILWADPEPKEVLLEMHRKIHSAISPEFCRTHYRPKGLDAALHARDAHGFLPKRGRAGVCGGISRRYPRRLRRRRLRRAPAIAGGCRGAAQCAGNLAHADYGIQDAGSIIKTNEQRNVEQRVPKKQL
jgi:hypothetical protein